ncbi:hypothetical protein F5Y15DRAFT_370411 [Xylariaceae sp. FL0016]|nr:hypothetical protein F5Y15DRAFT_370411 [Xylariaceae sp. FL0016]
MSYSPLARATISHCLLDLGFARKTWRHTTSTTPIEEQGPKTTTSDEGISLPADPNISIEERSSIFEDTDGIDYQLHDQMVHARCSPEEFEAVRDLQRDAMRLLDELCISDPSMILDFQFLLQEDLDAVNASTWVEGFCDDVYGKACDLLLRRLLAETARRARHIDKSVLKHRVCYFEVLGHYLHLLSVDERRSKVAPRDAFADRLGWAVTQSFRNRKLANGPERLPNPEVRWCRC